MSEINAISRDRVIKLMEENGFPGNRINHSVEVTDLALQISNLMIMNDLEVDKAVVEKGALLHDIGYLRCSAELVEIPEWKVHGIKIPSDDINHSATGAMIVKEWGFSGKVADCVLRHNIGGFTVEECKLLKMDPVPEKDCTPITLEEKVVHYADHLMLLKRLKLDPLRDPYASAKACLPWLKYYFMKRANMTIDIRNATVQREVALNNELEKYLKTLVKEQEKDF